MLSMSKHEQRADLSIEWPFACPHFDKLSVTCSLYQCDMGHYMTFGVVRSGVANSRPHPLAPLPPPNGGISQSLNEGEVR
jgi:hypothetical protein